jgi:AGZA family xanthine/uracil permease-like MFS transporter
MTALVPVVAISPILLYIGMLIGSQAFQESPRRHAPAIVVALVPSLAAWGKLQIDNSLGAISGIHLVTPEMIGKMQKVGIMYHGLSILGGGSILAGVILGATTTFIIDRQFSKAAGFAAAGGALTFLGLMHGEEVGAFENPTVVVAYFAVASILYACSRFAVVAPLPATEEHEEHAEHALALE